MGFSRQEYWIGWPFLPLGDLPDPGIEPGSPALQVDSLPTEPQGKPLTNIGPYENQFTCSYRKEQIVYKFPQKCPIPGAFLFLEL